MLCGCGYGDIPNCRIEAVEKLVTSSGRYPEESAVIKGSSSCRHTIQITVGCLQESRIGR